MAQSDMNIANQGFPAFRADLNAALAALVSNSSGATAPSATFPHQFWVDTSASPSVLKQRNLDDDAWVTIGTIDETTGAFKVASGSVDIVDVDGLQDALDDKADQATTYTKTEVDARRSSKIEPVTASVATNALTVTLNPTVLDFRSATLGSGAVTTRNIGSAISAVVPSGATLGTTNAVLSRVMILAIDNAGTVELAVCNSSATLDESALISTTVLDTASDSATVVYSTTARTNVPFRVVGFIESTQSTAGTWASAPSKIQGAGSLADIKVALNASGPAPIYAARAWVNFNGTGTVAIRASGNVSSITDNGVGDYTVNFTTAMPDANYSIVGSCAAIPGVDPSVLQINTGPFPTEAASTTTQSRLSISRTSGGGGGVDNAFVSVSFFR